MIINRTIDKLRPLPKQFSLKYEFVFSMGVVIFGLLLGYIAKATDNVPFIGELTTELGIWVFAATLIAVYSRYPFSAAINVMIFFLSVLCSYYIYGQLVLGFFPRSYFMGWLIVSFLSTAAGFVVWFSKGTGATAIITAALPIAVLFAWGYPAFYTYRLTLFLTLIFGLLLNVLLPKGRKQMAIVFVLSIILAFLISKFHLLSYLPF